MRALWLSLILVACGSPGRHSHSLHVSKVSADNHKCGSDAIRTGQFTPSGEPIRFWVPCWNANADSRFRVHVRPDDRAKLTSVEATQCVGLAPSALEYSPFAQQDAIAEIVPHRSGGAIRGVHVLFEPVAGLTVSWVRRAITCHRARWRALGMPSDYLRGDPTLVDDANITVTEDDHRVVVFIEIEDDANAQLSFTRAEGLVAERVATH